MQEGPQDLRPPLVAKLDKGVILMSASPSPDVGGGPGFRALSAALAEEKVLRHMARSITAGIADGTDTPLVPLPRPQLGKSQPRRRMPHSALPGRVGAAHES